MNFKKILIILRKVIAVLIPMMYDKHLDYDQEEIKKVESHESDGDPPHHIDG